LQPTGAQILRGVSSFVTINDTQKLLEGPADEAFATKMGKDFLPSPKSRNKGRRKLGGGQREGATNVRSGF
jgi:hypothetical protein